MALDLWITKTTAVAYPEYMIYLFGALVRRKGLLSPSRLRWLVALVVIVVISSGSLCAVALLLYRLSHTVIILVRCLVCFDSLDGSFFGRERGKRGKREAGFQTFVCLAMNFGRREGRGIALIMRTRGHYEIRVDMQARSLK